MKESSGSSVNASPSAGLDAVKPPRERIFSGQCEPAPVGLDGIVLRRFASVDCGAKAMSTGTAAFDPVARLPYHRHTVGEAITILSGQASVAVEGRAYQLRAFDCIYVPPGAAHEVTNPSEQLQLVAHWSFATNSPSRELVENVFAVQNVGFGNPGQNDPEHIVRFHDAPRYELGDGTLFCDLFAGRLGAEGICGGYGEFNPGSSLPCHFHEYDESITIVTGEAVCEVKGQRYSLSNCDTAFVPQGRPHRFLNESNGTMAMVWVYAGSEPERTVVDSGYCTGSIPWTRE